MNYLILMYDTQSRKEFTQYEEESHRPLLFSDKEQAITHVKELNNNNEKDRFLFFYREIKVERVKPDDHDIREID